MKKNKFSVPEKEIKKNDFYLDDHDLRIALF